MSDSLYFILRVETGTRCPHCRKPLSPVSTTLSCHGRTRPGKKEFAEAVAAEPHRSIMCIEWAPTRGVTTEVMDDNYGRSWRDDLPLEAIPEIHQRITLYALACWASGNDNHFGNVPPLSAMMNYLSEPLSAVTKEF